MTLHPLRSTVLLAALAACHGNPDAMSVSLSPDPAYTTDDLSVVAALSAADLPDADNLDVTIAWDVDGQALADLEGATTVPSDRTAKGQTWTATATAARGSHVGVSAAASVTISNSLPVASASVAATTPGHQDITAEASATDADDDTVTLTWAWTDNGVATAFTDAVVPASATARGETWEATVTPNDGEADGAPIVIHTTIDNVPPVVTSVVLSPEVPTTETPLHATVTSEDADGDTVQLAYAWLVNGEIVPDAGADTLDAALFVKNDQVAARVTPNDGFVDGAAVDSATVTIQNSVPSIAAVTISPAPLHTNDAASCDASGWQDADGDTNSTLYEWTVNGEVASTSATLDSALFARGDVVACSAIPFDGQDQGTIVTSADTVVANTPPVLASATLSTTSPAEADTLTVDVSAATDADGDTVTFTYQWYVNGAPVATTATLDGSKFARGDTITVDVTPNDGTENGAPVTSDTATVVNTLPTAPTVAITPVPTYSNADMKCVATTPSADADGDPITYQVAWTRQGAPYTGPTTTTTSAGDTITPAQLVVGEVWACAMTPNDLSGHGPTGSSPATTIALRTDDGSVQSSAGLTCNSINAAYPGLGDGLFWIDPDGDGNTANAIQVFCDMTTAGGGFTLLTWTGDSNATGYGPPYPGFEYCASLGCARGSGVPPASIPALMDHSTEMAKGQSTGTKPSFDLLGNYMYAGRYVYGDMSRIEPQYDASACQTDGVVGTYADIVGTAVSNGVPVYMSLGFKYSNHNDYSSASTSQIWDIGVPNSFCYSQALVPGTWMGNWDPNGQYGPGLLNTAGAYSVWVR